MEPLSDTDVKSEKQHLITLNLSILQAVESSDKEDVYRESVRDGERKRIYESPTSDHFFHIEYKLLPGKSSQIFKTDVVTFGNVIAKVYTDRDNRVVQCWSEEKESDGVNSLNLNYFGWRHRHSFKINKAQLLELYDHVIEVRVWNSKSKVSARAKYDRPKAFRIPIRDPNTPRKGGDPDKDAIHVSEDSPGVVKRPSKFAVVSHDQVRRLKASNRHQSKIMMSSVHSVPVPRTKVSSLSVQNGNEGIESEGSMECVSRRSLNQEVQEEEGVASDLSKLRMDTDKTNSVHQLAPDSDVVQSSSIESTLSSSTSKHQIPAVQSRRRQMKLEAEAAEQARIEKEGIAVIRLKVLDLFGKSGSTCTKLMSPVKTLKHFEVCLSVSDLLTEELTKELNPMMITLVKASGLPSNPVPFATLQEKCDPVHAKYQFHTQPTHTTIGIPQTNEVAWNDTHVILLGTIDRHQLVEYLRGPPLVVEIHDRSFRQVDKSKPALFGEEKRDDVLGTHAFTAGMSHSMIAINQGERVWNPYGVAKLDLSGLLQGQKMLELLVPVTGGPRCSSDLHFLDNPVPLLPGDYIGSHCELKVLVEVSQPLCLTNTPPRSVPTVKTSSIKQRELTRTPSKLPGTPNRKKMTRGAFQLAKLEEYPEKFKNTCPFNRLIYIVSSEGEMLVQNVISKVNEINSKALGLEVLSEDVLCAALSTYKLTKEQMHSLECNVITGFHVEDWEQHIIVLEGLKTGGLKQIWDDLPHHFSQDKSIVKVLYNSEFEFSQRLYASLDVDLPKVKLYQPVNELTQHSLIYVKDSIPQRCFRALMALSELNFANEMSDVTRNNLFLTADEVTALSLQFALPVTVDFGDNDNNNLETTVERPQTPALLQQSAKKRDWDPLELTNPQFDKHLREREKLPTVDFIVANMLHTKALSELSSSRKPPRRHRSFSETGATPVHNYSTQTYNSVKLSKAKLRERLSLDPTHRYTYCQRYHSMTVLPIDVEAEQRAERRDACRKWRTKDGFVFSGVSDAKNNNAHSKQIDPGRNESLKEPFQDNLLHANTLKPTVERLHFNWDNRSSDFERWTRPPESFAPIPPITIHLAGESRAKELQESLDMDHEEWTSKLIVDNTRFQPHRKGIRTELTDSGPKATTQLDKLQGLLKDAPQKYSLKQNGLPVNDIPALHVVHNPSVDSKLNVLNVSADEVKQDGSSKGYVPGPNEKKSLKLDSNVIPLGETRPEYSCVQQHNKHHPQEFRLYYHIPTELTDI